VYKRRGALRFDLQQQRYSFDEHESLAIVVGELTIKEILAARPYMKGRLLDVGCGKRPYALIYDSLVEQSVGTEVAFSPHGTLAADVINYAENLPFSDRSFDTILCTEVLEHTRRPQQVVQEFARVLKPGGYLLLTVPFIYPVHEAPHDYWRFTNYGLRAICEAAGLTPLYVHQKG
jgi:SAM-dependent methyltransferase